ncbi:MAG: zinc ribbon domain-containing protein [Oscillospiraceae bacterium]|nr:zinc ribbon domain-containing protein [Oscillospiraceae bacterium]
MFCRFCGKEIQDESSFCAYCGKNLSAPTQTVKENIDSAEPVTQEDHTPPEAAPLPEETVHEETQQMPTAAEAVTAVRSDIWRKAVLGVLLLSVLVISILFVTKVLCFHAWEEATCTAPMTCANCGRTQGEPLPHRLLSATCTKPIRCLTCSSTFGSALGHSIREATCTKPRDCFRCNMTWGEPLEHTWIEETFTTPKTCADCGTMRPMTAPKSGTVYTDAKKYYGSSLTFNAAGDFNTFVKLKDENGNDIFSFFVNAGETAKVNVPTGNYYLYMAHGNDWYGPELAFGEETYYEKEEQVFDFYNYLWTYTMDYGEDGNGVTVEVQEDDF